VKIIIAFLVALGVIALGILAFTFLKSASSGTVIILNGPSGSGKSSIQKEFQKLMMPNLWLKIGIDGFFDGVMPEITPENMAYWQSPNPIRWIEKSKDAQGNDIITLHVGPEGEKVAYAMNSAIAAYAKNGCNIIVDYIAYKQEWLADLEKKLTRFKTYYVAVKIPLEILEQREEARGTSPKGHARSHYFSVYGARKYDLTVDSQKNSAQEIAQRLKMLIRQ
jgi:chloramphenicol 3-O phosphotransferase